MNSIIVWCRYMSGMRRAKMRNIEIEIEEIKLVGGL